MKRILLFLSLFAISFTTQAQLTINSTQTPTQLVQNVLLGSGVTVSNIKFNGSAVDANALRDQVGHFMNGSLTNIGIDDGVILSTGKTSVAIGPNNSSGSSSVTSNPSTGDPDLDLLTTNTVDNKAILEFDFVPVGQNLNFNFVFGSEEYHEFANSNFNDVFGFFLSGPGINGPYSNNAINIALIPSTTIPITINNLNNGTTNTGPCEYCAYYVSNDAGATIQYDAFTTVISAAATVQCGLTYHIKLAIANVGDNSYDSAVFLKGGSFNTSPVTLPNDFLISNGSALCNGSTFNIDSGLDPTIVHSWSYNGVSIPGATNPVLTVSQPGVYCLTAYPYGSGCPASDCVTVEFLPVMPTSIPIDLTICD